MAPPQYIDPEEAIRREDKIRRGLDPDFRYTPYRFATVAQYRRNVPHFIETVGFNNIGVLFLSFRSHIGVREARRRFNNIWRRFFRDIFGHWICMVQFTKNYRIHFHLLVDCRGDIRTGFGLEQCKDYIRANRKAGNIGPKLTLRERRAMRDAIPANDLLRRCWAVCDKGIPSFGFGRVWDLFPILENADAITNYLIKGFLSGLPLQLKLGRNQRAKLITYSVGCPRAVPPGWRPPSDWFPVRLKALLLVFGMSDKIELKNELDRRWAFAVMRLCHWLDTNWHDGWPFMGPAALAPKVLLAITTDDAIGHYFDHLRGRVDRTMEAFIPPPGPPPPPPSIPAVGIPPNFLPYEFADR